MAKHLNHKADLWSKLWLALRVKREFSPSTWLVYMLLVMPVVFVMLGTIAGDVEWSAPFFIGVSTYVACVASLLWIIPALKNLLRRILERSRYARFGFAWTVKWAAIGMALLFVFGPIVVAWTMFPSVDWYWKVGVSIGWPMLLLWEDRNQGYSDTVKLLNAAAFRPSDYLRR